MHYCGRSFAFGDIKQIVCSAVVKTGEFQSFSWTHFTSLVIKSGK
jgi:hypothetical protein